MIGIIDYEVGNLASIKNMLKKIELDSFFIQDSSDFSKATKLILPGVGSFDYGMEQLEKKGFIEAMGNQVLKEKKPILGICLGAQLLTQSSEEGEKKGLGWVNATTVKFKTQLPVPNMGWNDIKITQENKLLKGFHDIPRFYFVHSYHFKFNEGEQVLAYANYDYDYACAFQKENIFGVQFHPEKSHKFGMQLLKNFSQNF
jgi:glutamine amidotransferase